MGLGLGGHGIEGDLFFQIVIADQRESVGTGLRAGFSCWKLTGVGWVGKELGNRILEMTLYALALDANLAHGFEIAVLLIVAAGIVGQFEE